MAGVRLLTPVPKTHRTKVPYTAFGSAGKNAFDYVTRRFNLSSARLNQLQGLDFR
jgi:hypothetical protein